MKRFSASLVVATSLLAYASFASAAAPVVEFELDEQYAAMSPAAGEPPLSSDEVDHNIDTLTPAERAEAAASTATDAPEEPAVPMAAKPAQKIIPVTPVAEKEPAPVPEKPAVFVPGKADKVPADAKLKTPKAQEIPLIETHNDSIIGPDVTYVTGGIGQDEKEAIEAAKGDYNLYIMSASTEGAFVGDAHVTITHKAGAETETVLSVVAGPLLYVKLPAGTYMLEAKLGEQTKKQTLNIGKKPSTANVHLGWKVPTHTSK